MFDNSTYGVRLRAYASCGDTLLAYCWTQIDATWDCEYPRIRCALMDGSSVAVGSILTRSVFRFFFLYLPEISVFSYREMNIECEYLCSSAQFLGQSNRKPWSNKHVPRGLEGSRVTNICHRSVLHTVRATCTTIRLERTADTHHTIMYEGCANRYS